MWTPLWRRSEAGAHWVKRLLAKVPHGRWTTITFLAALRHDRVEAPWLIDGPINGESFSLYIDKVLIPGLGAECVSNQPDRGKLHRAHEKGVGMNTHPFPRDLRLVL